jgi:hypothetical protein
MENIGPVVFFLLYMAISAWAKQRKNKAKAESEASSRTESETAEPKPVSAVESIFDKLKQELFQEEVEVPFMEYDPEPIEVLEEVIDPVDYPEPQYMEGSDSLTDHDQMVHIVESEPSVVIEQENPLKGVLEAYSTTQQGIVLREILGKPRAQQKDSEWFHFG